MDDLAVKIFPPANSRNQWPLRNTCSTTKVVPILLKPYLKLGAQVLAFNVDANFCDSLDGLIVVDLRKTDPRYLEKVMGEEAARLVINNRSATAARIA
jgi:hypothetical protein